MSEDIKNFENKLVTESNGDSDADIDELLEELELEDELNNNKNDEDAAFLNRYREQRMQDISDHLKKVEKNVLHEGYGKLEVITDEKKIIDLTTSNKRAVISFMIPSFRKCQYMNEKLDKLSKRHLTTKFVTITVENCPFLVHKLQIKVLPFVVGYKDGIEKLRIVGFSALGNDPNGFEIDSLEKLLYSKNIIETMKGISNNINIKQIKKTIRDRHSDEDSDSGLDI
ncbi:hypothetical protein TPHA_0C02400 [Tetrapisispora phaffii CBS 4417]|uniref:Phosducin domain-containing protein n=1 Tax=Tetrapisispora phaffii (strain ATCC 24235 / CBS 4417 / NBRC 1672 / NRRL Y-8282 / UCD 70-5) TaxID=1071381 RepID=G8BRL7_TETPH|nr:hypothetical protein TPHA_0C02400 [Tetrapisispora phaffii CBS 4417]CCE62393.1 hypothetical protein TPHA_0C02400 [Tetrapisispora phaffii CBS 4417]